MVFGPWRRAIISRTWSCSGVGSGWPPRRKFLEVVDANWGEDLFVGTVGQAGLAIDVCSFMGGHALLSKAIRMAHGLV